MKKTFLKIILYALLIIVSFAYGVYIAVREVFPYAQIIYLKNKITEGGVKRSVDTLHRTKAVYEPNLKTGVFMTYGQSNSVNNSQFGYAVSGKVYQYFNKSLYKYEDPALGGTGRNGSVWGMVGDKLIASGAYDQVIFSLAGVGSTPIEQLNSGEYYEYFKNAYNQLKKRFGKVDGILFHQGESNHREVALSSNYQKEFLIFLENMKNDQINSPIYVSQASFCDPGNTMRGIDSDLLKDQDALIKNNPGVLRGPNTDLLTDRKYRLNDNCHFSMLGLDKYSDLWVIAIKNSKED